MPGRNPRAASRIPLVALPAVVVALAQPVIAAPAPSPAASPANGLARERVIEVEVAASGASGSLRTEPEFLSGDRAGRYRFGAGCGDAMATPVLAQLLGALDSGKPLTVITDADAAAKAPCVSKLVFYAR